MMHHDRFDAVTREAAAGLSRRETLRSVGAMVAGLAALPIAGAAAQTTESTQATGQKTDDRCDKAVRKCKKIGKDLCNGDAGCNRSFKKCCQRCFSDRFLRCLRNEGSA